MTSVVEKRRLRRVLRRPTTHWISLVLVLAALVVTLAVSTVLATSPRDLRLGRSVFRTVDDRPGPVLDVGGPRLRSARTDADAVAVAIVGPIDGAAFDQVTRTLDEHRARATWFVEGDSVIDNRGAVRELRQAGVEVGVTGFTGVDLRSLPDWRRRAELSLSQAALAADAGITAPLLLLPATPTLDVLDDASMSTAREAGRQGYLLVAGTWAASAEGGDVAVVPTGAGVGRRLDALLDRIADEGLAPTTVSGLARLEPSAVNHRVDGITRANAVAIVGAVRAARTTTAVLDLLFAPLAVLIGIRALLAVLFAARHARRSRHGAATGWTGPVSVIVPAYNEEAGIEATLRSLLASDWPHGLDVVVVDDGSTDGTSGVVEDLALPGVRLLRQANTGKPGALNAGIAAAHADIVVLLDGDTVFQPDTIRELVAPFAHEGVGGVSGNAKVANRRRILGWCQHVEYVIGFNLDRRLLDTLGAITTIPGAVGAFRRSALLTVGGFSDDTIAEDTDVTIAISRLGWRVVHRDRAIAWTEAPSTLGDLWKQRYRWCYGTLQSVWKHRGAVREGSQVGLIGLPFALVFQVAVALLGPVIDVVALFALATGDDRVAVAWVAFTLVQVLLAAYALRLDGESLRPLWVIPLQQVFYRQLMYLVVIQSAFSAVAGARLRWHKLHRVGIGAYGSPIPLGSPPLSSGRQDGGANDDASGGAHDDASPDPVGAAGPADGGGVAP